MDQSEARKSAKVGTITAKLVCIWAKLVVFGQIGCIRANWLYLVKIICI